MLVRAACYPPEAALQAWLEFRRRVGETALDKTSMDLLPSVYANLKAYAPASEAITSLQAAYQRSWLKTQTNFSQGASALALLASHGIETVILKGAALVASGYRDLGGRPMADVDILVPLAQAAEAQEALTGDGWRLVDPPGGTPEHIVRITHAVGMLRGNGGSIDLHWHLVTDNCNPGDDDTYLEAAMPTILHGAATKRLCPADLLFHVMVHGAKFNMPRTIVWSVDSYMILQRDGESMDWQRLLWQAQTHGLTLPVLSCLEYLRDELGVPVPEATTTALRSTRASLVNRLNFRFQDRADTTLSLILRDTTHYLRRTRGRSLADRARGAVWYLQATRGVDDVRKLPLEMVRRFYRRAAGLPP